MRMIACIHMSTQVASSTDILARVTYLGLLAKGRLSLGCGTAFGSLSGLDSCQLSSLAR